MTEQQDSALKRVNKAYDKYIDAQYAFNALARQYMWNKLPTTLAAMEKAIAKEKRTHAAYLRESERLAAAWESCAV